MSIVTGVYIIVNVGQSAPACLADDNDGTPVIVNPEQGDTQERVRWTVNRLSNGNYTIKNVGSNLFAVAGSPSRVHEGTVVQGRTDPQQWVIQETGVKGQFTIAMTNITDTRLSWAVLDNRPNTPVTLYSAATDTRNSWIFKPVTQ